MRKIPASVLTALLMVGAAGCTGNEPVQPPAAQQQVAVLPGAIPNTFQSTPAWQTEMAQGTLPVTTRYGVLAVAPGREKNTWYATMLDAKTGQQRWQTIPLRTVNDSPPTVAMVSQGDRDWMVAWFPVGGSLQVLSFDPFASGDNVSPTHQEVLTGVNGAPPTMKVTDTAIMVSQDASTPEPYRYWPQTGAKTTFKQGPARNGQQGVPEWGYGAGWVVSYPGGGYAFASPRGGWESSTVHPEGVDASQGTLVALTNGVLFSRWPNGAAELVVAQDVQTGKVLGTVRHAGSEPVEGMGDPVVAHDHTWAALGPYVINFRTGDGAKRLVNGGRPTAVLQGVVYYADVKTPPSGAEEGFQGNLAVDAATGVVIDHRAQGRLQAVTGTSGLFLFPGNSEGTDILCSVSVK